MNSFRMRGLSPRLPAAGLAGVLLLASGGWLRAGEEAHPPVASGEKTSSVLMRDAREAAGKAGLKVPWARAVGTVRDREPVFRRSHIAMNAVGPPEEVRRWLEGLDAIDEFRVTASVNVQPLGSNLKLQQCLVGIHQWFASAGAAVPDKQLAEAWKRIEKRTSDHISPVDAWKEILRCLPEESRPKLRLVEVRQELGTSKEDADRILILGKGKSLPAIERFGENLRKSKGFSHCKWADLRTWKEEAGAWDFRLEASSAKEKP